MDLLHQPCSYVYFSSRYDDLICSQLVSTHSASWHLFALVARSKNFGLPSGYMSICSQDMRCYMRYAHLSPKEPRQPRRIERLKARHRSALDHTYQTMIPHDLTASRSVCDGMDGPGVMTLRVVIYKESADIRVCCTVVRAGRHSGGQTDPPPPLHSNPR